MRKLLAASWLIFAALGCTRDLTLPAPPPPPPPVTPGSISGRVVIAQPGRGEAVPAPGATVGLLSTSLSATCDSQGRFIIEGITRASGDLLIAFDANSDGQPERQRLIQLEAVKGGPGRFIDLGDVAIGENARVRGRVLRSDVSTSGGHAGSLVFVPEGPFTAVTADDGSFVLPDLPEGALRLAFFRAGYLPKGFENITLSSGEEMTLREIVLEPAPGPQATGGLKGMVVISNGEPLGDARVSAQGSSGEVLSATPETAGAFSFPTLPPDVYTVTVTRTGFKTARVNNVIVLSAKTSDLGDITLEPGASSVIDAGSGGGGGAGTDGGTVADAGPDLWTPTARATPLIVTRTGSTVQLDGTQSSNPGGSPLVFHWRELSDAGVALSANDSALALTPTFTAPGGPVVLEFELTVTNGRGLTSAPAASRVEVVAPPKVVVQPSGTVRVKAGGSVLLDATTSTDPSSAPLTFTWTVEQGAVTVVNAADGGVATGPLVRVNAPNVVETSLVRVTARNAYVASDPLTVPIAVHNDPPSLVVDGGVPQFVGMAETAVLSAWATATDPSETLSYVWAQVPTDGGVAVSIAGASSRVASFTAPSAVGPLQFRVIATASPSNVTASALHTVHVLDNQPPKLVASEPVEGTGNVIGPWLRLTATFDEALDLATVAPANFQIFEGSTSVPTSVTWDGPTKTVIVTPHRPLKASAVHSFVIGAVRDTSPGQNAFGGKTLTFTARPPTVTGWTSAFQTIEPRPAVAATATRVWVVGRTDGCSTGVSHAWSPSTTASTLDGQSTGLGSCIPYESDQKRVGVVGEMIQWMAGGPGYPNPPYQYVFNNGSWSGMGASGCIGLFGDGASLGGTTGGYWCRYSNGTWSTENFAPNNWLGYNNDAAGGAINGGLRLYAGLLSNRTMLMYESVNGGTWADISPTPVIGGVYGPRPVYVGTSPALCYSHEAPSMQISCAVRNGTTWTHYTNVSGGISGRFFDAISFAKGIWAAYDSAGKIFVKGVDLTAASPSFAQVNGPGQSGAFNTVATCTASRPEMFQRPEAIYLTWQESCPSGWRVQLARLD